MIEQDFDMARLIAVYLAGELSTTEREELDRWRQDSPAHEALFHRLCDEKRLEEQFRLRRSFDTSTAWNQLQQQIRRKHLHRIYIRVMSVAALFLLPILAFGTIWYLSSRKSDVGQVKPMANVIQPGKPQAVLTLDDGEMLALGVQSDTLLQQADETILQMDSASVSYHRFATDVQPGKQLSYNTLETPKGGEYTLALSDGTKVYLNAMSRLRFPVSFGEGSREVELEGEAFFHVSKAGIPFRVHTQGMMVEVLGTSFNLSAYPNELYQTTLVTGSVEVRTDGGEHCRLSPAQQASLLPGREGIEVHTVDTHFYTSWIEGKIQFRDQRLEDIMKTLSRWYDMKVVYADSTLKELRFGCNVDRYADITPFVQLLERTGKVRVRIHEKIITFFK